MLYRTQYMKRKYGNGGSIDYGAVAGMVGGANDAFSSTNQYGRKSVGSSAIGGLAKGASIGAAAGPWGAAIGAVVGGVIGLLSGKKAKRKEGVMLADDAIKRRQWDQNQMGAQLQADPSLYQGYQDAQYMKTGGTLRPKLSKGGWTSTPKPQDLINGLIQKRDSGEITLEEYGRTYREYLTSPQGQAYVKTTYPKSGYSMTYRDEKSPTKQSTWALPDKEAFELMTKGNPGYNPQTVTLNEAGGSASGYLNVPKKGNGGSLWETNKPAYVDSTLAANKKLDFVKRMYDKNPKTIQVPGQPNKSTHLMAYDPGTKRAYPEVVNQGGNLKHLQGDAAWDYANSTGEFIEFPRAEQAKWFATNGYKQGTGVLKRATGGSLKPISSDGVDVQGASHAQGGVQLDLSKPGWMADKDAIHAPELGGYFKKRKK